MYPLVSNHVSRSFARKLEARDVTVAEWALRRVLYDEAPMPPSHLAQRTVTRLGITALAVD